MKRKLLRNGLPLTILLAMMLLMIAGCQSPTSSPTSGTTKGGTTAAGTTATTKAAAKLPDYLNPDGYYPIVKAGKDITLSVGIGKSTNPAAGNPEDLWLFKYLTKYMNIKFKFTTIPSGNWAQQKTLLFASGDIFDVAVGLTLSTTDLVLYGKEEKQIMPINDLITKDLTPAMYAYFQAKPNALALATASDGKVYSVPRIQVDTYTTNVASFINEVALAANGFKVPATLDEFVKLARDWKAKFPNSTPVSGGYSSSGPMKLILSALGVVTQSNAGSDAGLETSPSLYKGKVTIPAANKEVYTQYVTTMKTLLSEKLISTDFFTLDNNARNASVAKGDAIILTGFPYSSGASNFDDWEAMVPLTSSLNSTPQWDAFNPVAVGSVWLGADCAYPEVAMRWFDWYFTDQGCVYMWLGPMQGTKETMDIVPGWSFDDKNAIVSKAVIDKTYANLGDYYLGMISPGIVAGNYSSIYRARLVMAGKEWKSDIDSMTASTGDNNGQISMYNKMKKYVVDGFPAITYVDSATATKISQLKTVLDTYVKNQSARFITGERPLSEVDAFINELNNMGLKDYLKIYEDIYASYQAALK
jgi:putative aldouronate transport system substrate-binding protein